MSDPISGYPSFTYTLWADKKLFSRLAQRTSMIVVVGIAGINNESAYGSISSSQYRWLPVAQSIKIHHLWDHRLTFLWVHGILPYPILTKTHMYTTGSRSRYNYYFRGFNMVRFLVVLLLWDFSPLGLYGWLTGHIHVDYCMVCMIQPSFHQGTRFHLGLWKSNGVSHRLHGDVECNLSNGLPHTGWNISTRWYSVNSQGLHSIKWYMHFLTSHLVMQLGPLLWGSWISWQDHLKSRLLRIMRNNYETGNVGNVKCPGCVVVNPT